MGQAQHALPTLREELDRKAFEAIDWLVTAEQRKKITPEQFRTGVNALFMAVSGLVDEEITDLITVAAGTVSNVIPSVRRHFFRVSDGYIVSVTWMCDDERLHVVKRQGGVIKDSWTREYKSPGQARQTMEFMAYELQKKGFEEL